MLNVNLRTLLVVDFYQPGPGQVSVFYAETHPPVLWMGKTKCGRVLICVDGSGRVNKFFFNSYVKETTMLNTLKNRKLSYAGHIMRNTSGHNDTLLTTIEGRLNGIFFFNQDEHGLTISETGLAPNDTNK